MIRVFNSNDKLYDTNGNVVLKPTYANVHKEDNGAYYLDIETNLQNEVIKHIEAQAGTNIEINSSVTLTDVDATKEAEITALKGQTTQASTPTPSSPQPINVVSGEQDINVCRKNLLDLSQVEIGKAWNNASNSARAVCYVKVEPSTKYTISYNNISTFDGVYYFEKVNKTDTTASSVIQITATRTITTQATTQYLGLQFNKSSISTSDFTGLEIQIEKGETSSTYEAYTGNTYEINLGYENLWKNQKTGWLPQSGAYPTTMSGYPNARYVLVYLYANQSLTLSNSTNNQGRVRCIDIDTNQVVNSFTSTDTTYYTTTHLFGDGFYAGTITAKKDFIVGIMDMQGNINDLVVNYGPTPQTPTNNPIELCKIGTYQDKILKGTGKNLFDEETAKGSGGPGQTKTLMTIQLEPSTQYTFTRYVNTTFARNNGYYLYFVKGEDTSTRIFDLMHSSMTNPIESGHTTITTGASGIIKLMGVYAEAGRVENYFENVNVQIEKGQTSTFYEPFGLEKGKWYLHKEVGKVVLNGSENGWSKTSDTSTSVFVITGMFTDRNRNQSNLSLSNYFKYQFANSEGKFYFGSSNTNNLAFCMATTYDLAGFKTWLASNNVSVYYVLSTPTNTPIEDSELLEQLDSLDSMRLYEGVTNISITANDLTPYLTLHYNYSTGGDVTTGDYLQPNNILVANTPTGNQAFRITSIEKTRHKIKIKANHVFYDSMNYVIQDSYVVDKNLNDALDHLNNATDNTSPFTTLSNVTTINSYRCVRKSLYEAVNVLLERWGGHLVRDNFNLKIMDAIGQDNGVTVRYGKNLKDITVDYNWDNVVTKILPVGYDGLLLDEIYIYADIQYDVPYTKVVHFEQDLDINDYKDEDGNVDEEAYQNALKADLRSQAHEYLQQNSIPKVNYELQANLEKITDVGDVIEVIDERLGVNIMTSLISYDYDCILEKYTTLEFGNFQKKLNDLTSYIETQSSEVATEISNETKVTLQTELAQATSQLWGVLGNSYVIYEGDKILVVDSLPKESATNVLMINSGGIGFSNTGINGTFSSAWTIDGTLNMENINVINLTADLIKGGTLKLGSNINQNGILEVYDEANNLIAQLTKDGLRMNATDGGYLLINTTVGFSGYDRNDNRIYWVDGDEFHMKKSVVEEEITLVDKMRIIPITITENNVIVNDGIGFVSTL